MLYFPGKFRQVRPGIYDSVTLVKGVHPMSQAVSNDQVSSLQPFPHKYRRSWVTVSVCILLLVILGVAFFYYHYYFNASERYFFHADGWAAEAAPVKVGQVFAVGVDVMTISDTETITMRPVTLPNGLPAHLHIIRQEITSAGVSIWPDWPNNWPSHPLVIHPLDGYRVGPRTTMSAVLVFKADAPGAYTLGPFT